MLKLEYLLIYWKFPMINGINFKLSLKFIWLLLLSQTLMAYVHSVNEYRKLVGWFWEIVKLYLVFSAFKYVVGLCQGHKHILSYSMPMVRSNDLQGLIAPMDLFCVREFSFWVFEWSFLMNFCSQILPIALLLLLLLLLHLELSHRYGWIEIYNYPIISWSWRAVSRKVFC